MKLLVNGSDTEPPSRYNGIMIFNSKDAVSKDQDSNIVSGEFMFVSCLFMIFLIAGYKISAYQNIKPTEMNEKEIEDENKKKEK